jgi:dienelactone hydrolase
MALQLEVSPREVLLDEPVRIRVRGAAPGQAVTIRAALRDARGRDWTSRATFAADASGAVDVTEQAPASGSYDGVDAMGLCWSMRPDREDGGPHPIPLTSTDRPASLDPLRVSLTAETAGSPAASGVFEQRRLAAGVRRETLTPETADGLAGELFTPAGTGPSPVVIAVSGSGGGAPAGKAALLASRGFAALALGYFNYPGRPAQLAEQPLEYFEQAIRRLQQRPDIDGTRIGVTGISRGGELALLLGSTFPQIRCVVAYQPSAFVGRGVGRDASARSAWSRGGEPLPYLRWRGDTDIYAPPGDGDEQPYILARGFLAALEDRAAAGAAVIPVERITGALLLISGQDDQMWPSTLYADLVVRRLAARGHQHPYRHVSYPDAGHLIVAPNIATTVSHGRHAVIGRDFLYGGQPKAQARANLDAWAQELAFFREHLARS